MKTMRNTVMLSLSLMLKNRRSLLLYTVSSSLKLFQYYKKLQLWNLLSSSSLRPAEMSFNSSNRLMKRNKNRRSLFNLKKLTMLVKHTRAVAFLETR